MQEVVLWKEIDGFEGLYKVSNAGDIVSLKKKAGNGKQYDRNEMPMKLHVHTNGYQVVWLRKPGVHQKFYVHRIIAFHFLDPIEGKEYVNHKDKDRLHNHVRNLEYMTHAENMYHRDNYKKPDIAAVEIVGKYSEEINADDIPF